MAKVKIRLTPYNALAILSFLREFINDDNKDDYQFRAIHEAVEEYEQQFYDNTTDDALQDAVIESKVNYLIGKHPQT